MAGINEEVNELNNPLQIGTVTGGNYVEISTSGICKSYGIAKLIDPAEYRADWIAYAGIHAHDNATAQSIANGATYIKIQNFGDNDPSRNCTPDATNDIITIDKAGVYRVEGSFSFACGTNSVNSFVGVFKNGVEMDSMHFTLKIGTASDVVSAGLSGLLTLAATDELDVRIRHDQGIATNFTFSYMNFSVNKVDDV